MYNLIRKDGFIIHRLTNPTPIKLINKIIDSVFKKKENIKDDNIFIDKLFKCQNIINKLNIHKKILLNEKKFFNNLLRLKNIGNDLSVQTIIFLRGVRPSKKNENKQTLMVDFHRENFYCDGRFIEKQINIHIPIKNYNSRNSLKYIEKSHLIPDSKISTAFINSNKNGVKKFSKSHKLGLNYSPKKIIRGVNFSKTKRFKAKNKELVALTSRLIHGGAINLTNKVKFSIDFAIIKTNDLKRDIKHNFSKPFYASYHKRKTRYVKLNFL